MEGRLNIAKGATDPSADCLDLQFRNHTIHFIIWFGDQK